MFSFLLSETLPFFILTSPLFLSLPLISCLCSISYVFIYLHVNFPIFLYYFYPVVDLLSLFCLSYTLFCFYCNIQNEIKLGLLVSLSFLSGRFSVTCSFSHDQWCQWRVILLYISPTFKFNNHLHIHNMYIFYFIYIFYDYVFTFIGFCERYSRVMVFSFFRLPHLFQRMWMDVSLEKFFSAYDKLSFGLFDP